MRTKYDVIAVLIVAGVVMFFGLLFSSNAHASVPESDIIHALAGEAGGQGEAEIIAHAHAIGHRIARFGDMRGIYGLGAKVTPNALKRAKKAYLKSKHIPDTVNHCDHWLSDYDLKHSRESLIAWRHKAVYSVKVGNTTFYKLK